MTFDWTINFGHILTALGLVGGAIGIVYAVRTDVKIIKGEIDSIKEDLRTMADVMVQLGKQEERINSVERRVSRLEDSR